MLRGEIHFMNFIIELGSYSNRKCIFMATKMQWKISITHLSVYNIYYLVFFPLQGAMRVESDQVARSYTRWLISQVCCWLWSLYRFLALYKFCSLQGTVGILHNGLLHEKNERIYYWKSLVCYMSYMKGGESIVWQVMLDNVVTVLIYPKSYETSLFSISQHMVFSVIT